MLSQLRFRPSHRIVSLIAILSREELAALTGPAKQVTKALPMPMAAHRRGATIICPSDSGVAALFGKLGKVVAVEDPGDFDTLSVLTATYATYFKYSDTIHGWLNDQGIADSKARDYIATLFKPLADAPETRAGASFIQLAEGYATRGGINEQILLELAAKNVFDAFAESLERVHRRISDA